jgi:hypothetical protein
LHRQSFDARVLAKSSLALDDRFVATDALSAIGSWVRGSSGKNPAR